MKKIFYKNPKYKTPFESYLKEAENKEFFEDYEKYILEFSKNQENLKFEIISRNGAIVYEYLNKPLKYDDWANKKGLF